MKGFKAGWGGGRRLDSQGESLGLRLAEDETQALLLCRVSGNKIDPEKLVPCLGSLSASYHYKKTPEIINSREEQVYLRSTLPCVPIAG